MTYIKILNKFYLATKYLNVSQTCTSFLYKWNNKTEEIKCF